MSVPEHLLVSLGWGRTPGQRLADAARRLAAAVHAREGAELARLVGDSGDVHPAEIGFAQPDLLHWRTDGGADRGTLSEIRDYYGRLNRGRLVVQGPPGAGKTVLAIALTRDLTAPAHHPIRRVAVRVSASSFEAGDALDQVPPAQLVDRLQAWLAGQLHTVYALTRREAVGLVGGGWILPVVDGVDEMDPPGQPPRRAAALLAALNHTTTAAGGGLPPVVLTCRAERYAHLVTPGAGVQDATVVQVEPLSPAAARAYLLYRFPDPARSRDGQPRWRRILGALDTAEADLAHGERLVVRTLGSPLRLFLAVDGYRDPAGDPDEMTRFDDPADLDAHLFARLIPAVTRQHPRPGGGHYAPEQVRLWLTTLSRHLAEREVAGGSGTDLLLHELWRAAGPRLPRHLAAAVLGLLTALPLLWLIPRLGDVVGATAVAVAVAYVVWRTATALTALQRIDLRVVRSPRGCRRLVAWVVGGLAAGLLSTTVGGLVAALALGVDFGAVFPSMVGSGLQIAVPVGLGFGLSVGVAQQPEAVRSPRELVVQGAGHAVVTCVIWIISGLVAWGVFGSAIGVACVVVSGLSIGLGASPWPRYLMTCVVLARRRRLPSRPARFLDWAYQAGMMRMAGVAVQFRHREFQAWLTRGDQSG